jgi:hypothetical protein
MDDFDAPPELANAQTLAEEWALGGGPITTERPRPPWLMVPPPRKRPFAWPSGGKSPSWFKRLSRCLLEHAHRYRRKRPDPSGLDAVVGNVLHGAIEDAANIRVFPGRRGAIPPSVSQEELLYLLELQQDCVRQDLDVHEGLPANRIVTTEVLARCRQIVAGMKPLKLDNIWVNRQPYLDRTARGFGNNKAGAEYIWSFQASPGLMIAGIADLIQIQPDPSNPTGPPLQVTVTDWKTGQGQLPTPDELALDAQAGLELCWARRAFPFTPRIRFRLVNLALNKEVSVDWSEGLDQLMLSFASACWGLWCQRREDPNVGSHCAYCAYRADCNPYQQHLSVSAAKPVTGLDGMELSELIHAFHEAKVLYDLAEKRKKDCSKRIMDALGQTKEYRSGPYLARQKRRQQSTWKDPVSLVMELADATGVDLESILQACVSIKKKGLDGFVQTLPVIKQPEARRLLEVHADTYYTKPWIEVSEKEPVI